MNFIIHCDGGARGNPGPAAIGVVIEKEKNANQKVTDLELITKFGKRIGETTNNIAEYSAVISALSYLQDYLSDIKGDSSQDHLVMNFYLDSLLVVNQLKGIFKIKEPHLQQLMHEVHDLTGKIGGGIYYTHIPRAQNSGADALVNAALDRLI